MYSFFSKIYKYFNSKAVHTNDSKNKMPLNKQKIFLQKFSEPVDDYERSYFKYKCFIKYHYYGRSWQLILYNLGAMFIYPFLHYKLLKKGREASNRNEADAFDAVVENVPRLPNKDVIPIEIAQQYENVIDIEEIKYGNAFLNPSSEKICSELKKRYFKNFYFRVIVMLKLAQFTQYLEDYSPSAIVFYSCEREFAGPLQTLLCEQNDARYESFMHGDYLYTLAFAFQRYSLYYVWDQAYEKMFDELRCSSPMKAYTPDKLKGIAKKLDDRECRYFATYYFSAESKDSVKKIGEVFDKFQGLDLRCKIRPHPRFSNLKLLNEVFSDIEIEDTTSISVADSITNSLYIIGLNTTVLSQAYFSDKEIVIDDISNREEYLELESRGYIMMSRPHWLLSELVHSLDSGSPYDSTFEFVDKASYD